jgi:hypothetical protein
MRTTSFALSVLIVLAVGCSRKHITAAHGVATRTTFAMQLAEPPKPPPPPNMALDTQEAQVIAKSYVRSLSGKTTTGEPESMLYLSSQREMAPIQLPPSVPRE